MGGELRQLRSFVALVEEGDASGAATRLGISRGVLTGHLDELERRMGGRLVHRPIRSIRVTELGGILFVRARLATEAVEHAIRTVRPQAPSPILRVGLSLHTDSELALAALTRMRDAEHDFAYELVSPGLDDATAGVADGTADVALVRAAVGTRELSLSVLRLEPVVYVLGREHRLARATSLCRADFQNERVLRVLRGDDSWSDETVQLSEPTQRSSPPTRLRPAPPVRSFPEWFMAVASGAAIGTAPASFAAQLPNTFAVLPGEDLECAVLSVCRRHAMQAHRMAELFIDAVQTVVNGRRSTYDRPAP